MSRFAIGMIARLAKAASIERTARFAGVLMKPEGDAVETELFAYASPDELVRAATVLLSHVRVASRWNDDDPRDSALRAQVEAALAALPFTLDPHDAADAPPAPTPVPQPVPAPAEVQS